MGDAFDQALSSSHCTAHCRQHGKLLAVAVDVASQIQSIMEYNGGSVIAMVGKDCVAIACDLRLGNQALGISSKFEKVRSARAASSIQ